MKRKLGITKAICYGAGIILTVLILGFVAAPAVANKMNNTQNYCFSDMTELQKFEQKLNEGKIPFSRLSDTTVNVSKEYGRYIAQVLAEQQEPGCFAPEFA